jgi:hypothetical protein
MEQDRSSVSFGIFTKIVYSAALVLVGAPFVTTIIRTAKLLGIETRSMFEHVASVYYIAIYLLAALLIVIRIIWVYKNDTGLDCPNGNDIALLTRGVGLFLLYLATMGSILSFAIVAINSAPSIFLIFSMPFRSAIPFALIIFELGRILSFESKGPNNRLQSDAATPRA